MKKNWLSGLYLLVAMLMCSVSWADVKPVVLPVATFDVVAVTDTGQIAEIVSLGSQERQNGDIFADIGAGSFGMVSDTGDWRDFEQGNLNQLKVTDNFEIVTCGHIIEPIETPTKVPIAI